MKTSCQLAFDFDAPVAETVAWPYRATAPRAKKVGPRIPSQLSAEDARYHAEQMQLRLDKARAHWKVGMVTSLPVMSSVQDVGYRYSMMLPGVVESIDGDKAAVRIYAAPEYGYTLPDYPLHLTLAIDVPLTDLGVHHHNDRLQSIVDAGALATGDQAMGESIRAQAEQRMATC